MVICTNKVCLGFLRTQTAYFIFFTWIPPHKRKCKSLRTDFAEIPELAEGRLRCRRPSHRTGWLGRRKWNDPQQKVIRVNLDIGGNFIQTGKPGRTAELLQVTYGNRPHINNIIKTYYRFILISRGANTITIFDYSTGSPSPLMSLYRQICNRRTRGYRNQESFFRFFAIPKLRTLFSFYLNSTASTARNVKTTFFDRAPSDGS